MITPRPRRYRGVLYRSTLEADWAATLHHLGVTAEYEPEAYQTPLGTYSPDFWLPAQKVWLEVKGPHGERVNKAEAFANLLAVAHEQHGFTTTDGQLVWKPILQEPVLVYGLPPTPDGRLSMRAAQAFYGAAAGFDQCTGCERWTVVAPFDLTGCRVCQWEMGAAHYLRYELGPQRSFRRARDDRDG